MKKIAGYLLIAVIFCSCSKEKEPSVVGLWIETANYRERTPGVYGWEDVRRWPLHLLMTAEGQYGQFNDVPAGNGLYKYNYSTRELIFESATTGFISRYTVSVLNENFMEIDLISNGVLLNKRRFMKRQ